MAKKNKRTKKHKAGKTRVLNLENPRIFYKQIGLKPLVKPNEVGTSSHMEKELIKYRGKEAVSNIEKSIEDPTKAFDLYHSCLQYVKVWYGVDFNRICSIASELADLSIPAKSNILDIGGGPGHLAFWLANIWNAANVTVADMHAEIGSEWAANIKENRVSFINSMLPELREIREQQYDVIVLSRILSFLNELNLPEGIMGLNIKAFLESEEGLRLFSELEKIGKRLYELTNSKGQLVIVDSWSADRVWLVCKAFEKVDLFIDIKRFYPEKIGIEPSVIVFSKSIDNIPIKDLPYSLSTVVKFPSGPPVYLGTTAESIRNLFINGNVLAHFEYKSNDNKIYKYNEIIEREGLILVYRADNGGIKNAWIYPAIFINDILKSFHTIENDLMMKGSGRIINKVLPN
jgi:2-polyprenyl-3-methyl-5-hydroxy-6-metoxy-1,4-benzoquinol methylase